MNPERMLQFYEAVSRADNADSVLEAQERLAQLEPRTDIIAHNLKILTHPAVARTACPTQTPSNDSLSSTTTPPPADSLPSPSLLLPTPLLSPPPSALKG